MVPTGVIVFCSQMNTGSIPGRFGMAFIECKMEDVSSLLGKDVGITTYDCGSVSMMYGMPGDSHGYEKLEPSDGCAKMLCEVTSIENWTKPIPECHLLGSIRIHGACKSTEVDLPGKF